MWDLHNGHLVMPAVLEQVRQQHRWPQGTSKVEGGAARQTTQLLPRPYTSHITTWLRPCTASRQLGQFVVERHQDGGHQELRPVTALSSATQPNIFTYLPALTFTVPKLGILTFNEHIVSCDPSENTF